MSVGAPSPSQRPLELHDPTCTAKIMADFRGLCQDAKSCRACSHVAMIHQRGGNSRLIVTLSALITLLYIVRTSQENALDLSNSDEA